MNEEKVLVTYREDGTIFLESQEVNLKITSDRKIWKQYPGTPHYEDTEKQAPKGLSRDEKSLFLQRLRRQYVTRGMDGYGRSDDSFEVSLGGAQQEGGNTYNE